MKKKRISLRKMASLVFSYNTVSGSRIDERKLLRLAMDKKPVFVK